MFNYDADPYQKEDPNGRMEPFTRPMQRPPMPSPFPTGRPPSMDTLAAQFGPAALQAKLGGPEAIKQPMPSPDGPPIAAAAGRLGGMWDNAPRPQRPPEPGGQVGALWEGMRTSPAIRPPQPVGIGPSEVKPDDFMGRLTQAAGPLARQGMSRYQRRRKMGGPGNTGPMAPPVAY
jgi:hypothetical protein